MLFILMNYDDKRVEQVANILKQKFEQLPIKADILRDPELKGLYGQIKTMPGS